MYLLSNNDSFQLPPALAGGIWSQCRIGFSQKVLEAI